MQRALDALNAGRGVVIATVLQRHGSAPATPGQKLALIDGRDALGTIGGGALEHAAIAAMRDAHAKARAKVHVEKFHLGPELGMCCGGWVEILLETHVPPPVVLVVGAGHISTALTPLLASAAFRVVVCDARQEVSEGAAHDGTSRPGQIQHLLETSYDDPEVRAALPPDLARSFALVMTHDHQIDQAAIEWALRQGFGFVGGVGSRAKAVRTRARLSAKKFSDHAIASVRMPLGLDIGARSPAEIAIAIASEVVQVRAGWVAKSPEVAEGSESGEQPNAE